MLLPVWWSRKRFGCLIMVIIRRLYDASYLEHLWCTYLSSVSKKPNAKMLLVISEWLLIFILMWQFIVLIFWPCFAGHQCYSKVWMICSKYHSYEKHFVNDFENKTMVKNGKNMISSIYHSCKSIDEWSEPSRYIGNLFINLWFIWNKCWLI